jgi:hypothetical protein
LLGTLILRTAVLAAFLSVLFLPAYFGAHSVSAHVHAVTPLNDCSVDNAEHSGGRIIPQTPAGSENGGPIEPGPIPLNTGNAAFDPATGGGNHGSPTCP